MKGSKKGFFGCTAEEKLEKNSAKWNRVPDDKSHVKGTEVLTVFCASAVIVRPGFQQSQAPETNGKI